MNILVKSPTNETYTRTVRDSQLRVDLNKSIFWATSPSKYIFIATVFTFLPRNDADSCETISSFLVYDWHIKLRWTVARCVCACVRACVRACVCVCVLCCALLTQTDHVLERKISACHLNASGFPPLKPSFPLLKPLSWLKPKLAHP